MNFFKSEIMRSYHRVAKEKGWVQPEVMVKQASVKDIDLSSGNDLFVDCCKLAQVLRIKGYVKQANDLEQKIMNLKLAEKSIYDEVEPSDILELAHPDGDVTIVEALNGYGDVETPTSQHNKILDAVKAVKKNSNLIKCAKSILKIAQVSVVQAIDTSRDGAVQAIGPIQSYSFDFDNLYSAYATGGNQYSILFEKYAGNNTRADMQLYGNYISAAYGAKSLNPASIEAKLKQSMSAINQAGFISAVQTGDTWHKEILQFVNRIEPGVFDAFVNQNYPDNFTTPNTLRGATYDGPGYARLASIIHARFVAIKAKVENKIVYANSSLQTTMAEIINYLAGIEIQDDYQKMKTAFSKFVSPESLSFMNSIMNTFGTNYDMYQKHIFEINSYIPKLSGANSSGLAQVTSTRFSKASEIYDDLASKIDLDGLEANAQKSLQIADAIQRYNSDFKKLTEVLGTLIPGVQFKNFEALDMFSQQWLTAARNNRKELGPKTFQLADFEE